MHIYILNIPLVEDINKHRFFPIENVVAVGEIKSILSKNVLEEALRRLCKIKEVRNSLSNPYIKSGPQIIENWDTVDLCKAEYNPLTHHQDQIVTFIICEKIDFAFDEFDFSEFYKEKEPSTKINMILSIEDGLFMYKHQDGVKHPYPVCKGSIDTFSVYKGNQSDPWLPIKVFASNLYTAMKCCVRLNSEIVQYMQVDKDALIETRLR